jgi:hypothetical protein
MQQFVVPQFIDVEDKILGPITVRQFLILLVVGLTDALIYRFADFTLFLFLAIILTVSGLILAFVKVNGQPFHYFLLNLIQTLMKPALRVWNKELSDAELRALVIAPPPPPAAPKAAKRLPTATRLSEISLMVNTGGAFRPEE